MSGSGGWGGFLRSFAQAFVKSATKQRHSGPEASARTEEAPRSDGGSVTATRAGSTSGAAARSPRVTNAVRDGNGYEDQLSSPGQHGADATRDLSRDEIARLAPHYGPQPDGDPDPGEIVWTWVPYVENDGRGKDRPVLIIARIDATTTAGCYLSTKRHDGFVSVGTGPWDSQGRESFVSPERVLRISDEGMRREGHVLPLAAFERAVSAVGREQGHDWA